MTCPLLAAGASAGLDATGPGEPGPPDPRVGLGEASGASARASHVLLAHVPQVRALPQNPPCTVAQVELGGGGVDALKLVEQVGEAAASAEHGDGLGQPLEVLELLGDGLLRKEVVREVVELGLRPPLGDALGELHQRVGPIEGVVVAGKVSGRDVAGATRGG